MADEYPTQEFLHDPDAGVVGDCYRACIAGLIGAKMADVPHFARDHGMDWWEAAVETVEALSSATMVWCPPEFPVYEVGDYPVVIASGPSPRGDFLHSVLVSPIDGTLVWDPHPSRAGLAGPIVELHCLTSRT